MRGSGADFADFLLGLPQQAAVQFGPGTVRLRGRSLSAFAQDDWRHSGALTFNLGVRYELTQPYTEANGRLVKALLAAGAQFDTQTLGVDTDRRFFNTREGQILAETVVPQQMTTWARLLNVLVQAYPAAQYHLGQNVTQVWDGDENEPARVQLADGRILQADLVVLAGCETGRGSVGAGGAQLIAGFVIGGNSAKKVLIRGVGPTLGAAPFNLAGVLADPFLRLVRADYHAEPKCLFHG